MKVLVQTEGSAGDVFPFIAIGRALRIRGHEVVLFANEAFEDAIRAAGLRHVGTDSSEVFSAAVADPDMRDPRKGTAVAVRLAMRNIRDKLRLLEDELSGGDIVVVGTTLGIAARLLRELHTVPHVSAHLAPLVFRSTHRLPRTEVLWVRDSSPEWLKRAWFRLVDALGDRAFGSELDRLRSDLGLTPVRRVFSDWLVYSPDLTMGLFPDWFAPRQPDWPESLGLPGFPLDAPGETPTISDDLMDWLATGDPPLVFAAGSTGFLDSDFFETAKDVTETLSVRALMVGAGPGRHSSAAIRWEAFAPFVPVFAHAQGVVSHGGIGTVARALAAGLPQLVVHVNFDQRDNGSRLVDLGTGGAIPRSRFRGESARRAVESVLGGGMRRAASRISEKIDPETSMNAICRSIETVA